MFEEINTGNTEAFRDAFVNKIDSIYEYSKMDIVEFLAPQTTPENERAQYRDRLSSRREGLFTKLFEKLPIYAKKQLYRRKKLEGLA